MTRLPLKEGMHILVGAPFMAGIERNRIRPKRAIVLHDLSQHTLGLEASAGRLVVLPVEGMPVMRRWFLVRHKSKRLTPALGAFWDFVLEFAPDYLKRLEHQAAGDK